MPRLPTVASASRHLSHSSIWGISPGIRTQRHRGRQSSLQTWQYIYGGGKGWKTNFTLCLCFSGSGMVQISISMGPLRIVDSLMGGEINWRNFFCIDLIFGELWQENLRCWSTASPLDSAHLIQNKKRYNTYSTAVLSQSLLKFIQALSKQLNRTL